MIRAKIGERILIKNFERRGSDPIEVKVLSRAPNFIKVEVLSDGWFKIGEIRWLDTNSRLNRSWYRVSQGTIKEK